MFAQRDPQTSLLVSEHLAGHQAVEDGGARQRDAEVEAEQPPVLGVLVELKRVGVPSNMDGRPSQ